MRAVTRAMLDDMPDPCDLHLERAEGRCLVMVGSAVLSEYGESDVVMRNFAVTTMRPAGFTGKRVAEVFGLRQDNHCRAAQPGSARGGGRSRSRSPGVPQIHAFRPERGGFPHVKLHMRRLFRYATAESGRTWTGSTCSARRTRNCPQKTSWPGASNCCSPSAAGGT
jgi:hypothetical protein